MVVSGSLGNMSLREENINKVVQGFALREYKMKSLVVTEATSAWQETYFQETAADLTVSGTIAIQGISRMAPFPSAEVTHLEKTGYQVKHGLEIEISFEDAISSKIDVLKRAMLRVARAVTRSVDTNIWNTITENQSVVNINSVTSTAAWNAASGQNPVEDILEAIEYIEEDDYPTDNLKLVVKPLGKKSLMNWVISSLGANVPQFSSELVGQKTITRFLGCEVISSSVVTDDYAAVVQAPCGIWKQLYPLTTRMIEDAGIKWTMRSYEFGVCLLTDPNKVSLISNVEA